MKFKLIVDPGQEEQVTAVVHAPSELTARIETLVLESQGSDKLWVCGEDTQLLLPIHSIECVTVIDGKTYAVDSKANRYRVKQRLYELEAVLPDSFIRINKSALANETRLLKFEASYSGAVDAVFCCGYREYVSRRCFAGIKRRFGIK